MTAALEGGEWSAARPGRTLPPGKTRYPFYRRLGVGWGNRQDSTGVGQGPVAGCCEYGNGHRFMKQGSLLTS